MFSNKPLVKYHQFEVNQLIQDLTAKFLSYFHCVEIGFRNVMHGIFLSKHSIILEIGLFNDS